VQEYLPQDHLTPGSTTASGASSHNPHRLVAEGRGIVARAQRPVQGGGQDAGDGVVVLWCRYEHGGGQGFSAPIGPNNLVAVCGA
jgi:hypothetical protein